MSLQVKFGLRNDEFVITSHARYGLGSVGSVPLDVFLVKIYLEYRAHFVIVLSTNQCSHFVNQRNLEPLTTDAGLT